MLEQVVLNRIRQSKPEIEDALKAIRANNPYAAEPSGIRRQKRFQSKLNLSARDAEALNAEVMRRASTVAQEDLEAAEAAQKKVAQGSDGREAIWGDTVDFVSVAFLELGAKVARSVGRVAYQSGRAKGSGILIGADLFLTNHHVIEDQRQADECVLEFRYERDLQGSLRAPSRFTIDRSVFVTDPVSGLDFTIFAVGDQMDGPDQLTEFGATYLSDASDKHMIGEFANIIQHPRGRFKEVVLRENRLVNRFDDALHYVADTEPGSSGSPVYNSEWKLIALHHWGGPWIDHDPGGGPAAFEINEGIRTSSIVRNLRHRMRSFSPSVRERVASVLSVGERTEPPVHNIHTTPGSSHSTQRSAGPSVQVHSDGRATWTLPIELSVKVPALSASATDMLVSKSLPSSLPASNFGEAQNDYSDRKGYLPDFLPGFHIPLPQLGPGLRNDAAKLLDPEPGVNPYELKYHHFSVVVNKRRRLAFFTACMIDGKSAKSIRRSDRKVSDLQASDAGLRESIDGLEDAEADSWSTDNRLDRGDYSGDEIYKGQKVPGFPNPRSRGRMARMFQKGHLIRRLDPAWGDEARALEAELDTFHWTNAAPQVGFFNQGTANEDQPGTGRGNLWRAAENYVLRNAVAEDQRVISFTGPVFHEDDRTYRHIQIPGKFFKVTAWADGGELRTLALLVDQQQVFDAWPEAMGTPEFLAKATEAEAFLDEDELDRVTDFLSTIEEIEELTELDFGDAIRSADVRRGEASLEVRTEDDLPLHEGRRRRTSTIPGALPQPDGQKDDLTRIRGIGRSLQHLLNNHGIFHFRQIADWGEEEIRAADALLRFSGRIVRDNWVEQAGGLLG